MKIHLDRSDRMPERHFKSSLSMEEIANNFKDIDFFPALWKD